MTFMNFFSRTTYTDLPSRGECACVGKRAPKGPSCKVDRMEREFTEILVKKVPSKQMDEYLNLSCGEKVDNIWKIRKHHVKLTSPFAAMKKININQWM